MGGAPLYSALEDTLPGVCLIETILFCDISGLNKAKFDGNLLTIFNVIFQKTFGLLAFGKKNIWTWCRSYAVVPNEPLNEEVVYSFQRNGVPTN